MVVEPKRKLLCLYYTSHPGFISLRANLSFAKILTLYYFIGCNSSSSSMEKQGIMTSSKTAKIIYVKRQRLVTNPHQPPGSPF